MSPVVIAGAGPNGLMLACELALAGVRPIVLDALPGASAEPKANGLVGQVVRTLDMRGLYRAFTGDDEPPRPSPGWAFAGLPMNFLGLQDNPMYAMRIPQPELVRLLEQRARELDVDLRWGHELTGVCDRSDHVELQITTANGPYDLCADYLVGADGGRSFVRKTVGIDFPGHTSPTVARLAHVHLPDCVRGADGGFDVPGVGPIPFGHNRFDRGMVIFAEFEAGRAMLGTMEFETPGDDGPMSLADLRASLRRVLGTDVPIEEPRGPGPHALRRIDGQNTRMARTYRRGRVLLLGDAAHVHSPLGGPGLNLGLQDTVNLGWKLAGQVLGWAPDGLLDSYESERRPVGERVMLHSMAQIALTAPGPEVGALRTLFAELLSLDEVAAHMAALLAGTDVVYDVGDDHPLSGRPVPPLTLADGRRVEELLHGGRPVLLDLSGGPVDVAGNWSDRVDTVCAAADEPPAAALLIRPDGCVAWAADDFGPQCVPALHAALARWFGPPTG